MFTNKFNNNLDDTPLHSSGYAEIARPKKIGAMSPQSFNQRLHVERNRQAVGTYHHSMIATGHHRNGHYQRMDITPAMRPNSGEVSAPRSRPDAPGFRSQNRLIADIKPARQNFSEPPSRGYNPYQ